MQHHTVQHLRCTLPDCIVVLCYSAAYPIILDLATVYCREFILNWIGNEVLGCFAMRSAAATNSRSCNIAQNSPLARANPLCQCHPSLVQLLIFSWGEHNTNLNFILPFSSCFTFYKYIWGHVHLQALVYSLMFVAQKYLRTFEALVDSYGALLNHLKLIWRKLQFSHFY